MNAAAKQVQIDMITADLQQCLDLLPPDQFELALHHLAEARTKIEQMRDSDAAEPPKPQQVTLEIE